MAVLTNKAKQNVLELIKSNEDFARSLNNFQHITSDISKDRINNSIKRKKRKARLRFGFRSTDPDSVNTQKEKEIRTGITKITNDIYMYREKNNRILFTIDQGPEGKNTVIILGAGNSISSIENLLKD